MLPGKLLRFHPSMNEMCTVGLQVEPSCEIFILISRFSAILHVNCLEIGLVKNNDVLSGSSPTMLPFSASRQPEIVCQLPEIVLMRQQCSPSRTFLNISVLASVKDIGQ